MKNSRTYPSGSEGKRGTVRKCSRSAFIQPRGSARWALPLFVSPDGLAAWGKGLPSVARCAGPRPTRPSGLRADTLPTLCGGGAAARPACLRQSGKCGGWSPPAAAQAKPAASRCAGPPSPAARPSPCGAASRALPPASPAPVAALVLRGGPAPTMWGLWGRPPLRPGRRRSGQPCQPGHACGAGRAARLCLRTRRPA